MNRVKVLFLTLFSLLLPNLVFAQCPSNPTLTPTVWGGASGSLSVGSGTYTVSGTGVYSTNQSFEKGYAALNTTSGSQQFQARVVSETGFVGTNAGAGIFIRDNATSSADGADLWLEGPGGNEYVYADRVSGGNLIERLWGTASIPYWLRIQNAGGVVTTGISSDGINWTPLQSFNLGSELGSGSLAYGLAVWSDDSSKPITVQFDNVCLSAITPMPTPTRTPGPSFTPLPGVKVWPNPVVPGVPPNDTTHFQLPAGHGAGHLIIADLKRHRVRSLDFGPGADVQWDAKDDSGTTVPSGVYLYLLEADGPVSRGSITVMR